MQARETGHAASLMPVMDLCMRLPTYQRVTTRQRRHYRMSLSRWPRKKAPFTGRPQGLLRRGQSFGLNWQRLGRSQHLHLERCPHAAQSGTTIRMPWHLCHLARACGELGQFEEAWSYIGEAITAVETTKEKWCEAEVHRIAGEIALISPERDVDKSRSLFRTGARGRASTAGEILGAARGYEHGAAVARAREAGRSPRTSRSGLRLVYRGL